MSEEKEARKRKADDQGKGRQPKHRLEAGTGVGEFAADAASSFSRKRPAGEPHDAGLVLFSCVLLSSESVVTFRLPPLIRVVAKAARRHRRRTRTSPSRR